MTNMYVKIADVNFHTFFSAESIKASLSLAVSASIRFGDADLVLTGHLSKGQYSAAGEKKASPIPKSANLGPIAESYMEARVGNLSWAAILQFHSQLTGASIDDHLEGHDLVFEDMYIKLSTKGVIIEGKVCLNGHTSVEGYLELDKDGIGIGGGVADFLIDNTGIEIKSARIDTFVASRGSTRTSKFSIQGKVTFSEITVLVAFMMQGASKPSSRSSKSQERQWALFGRLESNLCLKDMLPHPVEGDLIDLELSNVTIIAASGETSGLGDLNTLNYPVKRGEPKMVIIPAVTFTGANNSSRAVSLCHPLAYGTTEQVCQTGR